MTRLEDLPDVMPVDVVATFLDVDPRTVRSEIKAGRLEAVKIGRLIRVTKRALMKFLKIDEPGEDGLRVIEGGGDG